MRAISSCVLLAVPLDMSDLRAVGKPESPPQHGYKTLPRNLISASQLFGTHTFFNGSTRKITGNFGLSTCHRGATVAFKLTAHRSANPLISLVPAERFELPTNGLQNSCSLSSYHSISHLRSLIFHNFPGYFHPYRSILDPLYSPDRSA